MANILWLQDNLINVDEIAHCQRQEGLLMGIRFIYKSGVDVSIPYENEEQLDTDFGLIRKALGDD